jgi:hypothetical protein
MDDVSHQLGLASMDTSIPHCTVCCTWYVLLPWNKVFTHSGGHFYTIREKVLKSNVISYTDCLLVIQKTFSSFLFY